jgi:hypothetical protein
MIEEIEVTHELFPELAAQEHQRQHWHVLGPLPVSWLTRANVGANTLLVALAVKLACDWAGQEPVHLPRYLWRQLGLFDRDKRKRALDALETAGILRTERKPGQAVRIWLVDKP